jgi:hypothetical protein
MFGQGGADVLVGGPDRDVANGGPARECSAELERFCEL